MVLETRRKLCFRHGRRRGRGRRWGYRLLVVACLVVSWLLCQQVCSVAVVAWLSLMNHRVNGIFHFPGGGQLLQTPDNRRVVSVSDCVLSDNQYG